MMLSSCNVYHVHQSTNIVLVKMSKFILRVCADFHDNLSSSYWDISLKSTNANLMVALEEKE